MKQVQTYFEIAQKKEILHVDKCKAKTKSTRYVRGNCIAFILHLTLCNRITIDIRFSFIKSVTVSWAAIRRSHCFALRPSVESSFARSMKKTFQSPFRASRFKTKRVF